MNFALTEEQTAIIDALTKVTASHKALSPSQVLQHAVYSTKLERDLSEAGFLDLGLSALDSLCTCVLIVSELAQLPVCVEATGSALVRPAIRPDAPPPVALI